MSARVLVIGLDAATFDVIEPLIAAGRLPNLARLRAGGWARPLISTTPDKTPLAWTSCRTGVNPGKHGIFDFWQVKDYQWVFNTSAEIKVPAVEQILSRRGRRVCTVNVPLTYPPQPVNGLVISGLPTPGPESGYTYPPGLRMELLARLGEFDLDGNEDLDFSQPAQTVKTLYEHHRRRRETAQYLLEKERWDYFMVVFTLADKLQHAFWLARELFLQGSADPLVQRFGPVIDQCYELLDESVGKLVRAAGEDCAILVVSDHGFGPCRAEVYPNLWLAQQGYFRLRPAHQVWARQLAWTRRGRLPWPRIVIGAPRRRVDWRRTRAFLGLYQESKGLLFNLKGRFAQGVVTPGAEAERLADELEARLLAATTPQGERIFAAVYRPENLYHGAHVHDAPDLILLPANPATRVMGKLSGGEFYQTIADPYMSTGNHRPEGVLIAGGAAGQNGDLPAAASIMDIAPTVLALLGEDIPAYMDGRPLVSASL